MKDLAKAVQDHRSQAQVRRAMQHAACFKLDADLPDNIRSKLEELDRVVAAREAKA